MPETQRFYHNLYLYSITNLQKNKGGFEMSGMQKKQQKKRRKNGEKVIAFTARLNKNIYDTMLAYALESNQSIGLALDDLIQKALKN